MTEKIDASSIVDLIRAEQVRLRRRTDKPPAAGQVGDETELQNAEMIERVMRVAPDDQSKIERARRLVESGQLDKLANIRAAAANILELGI